MTRMRRLFATLTAMVAVAATMQVVGAPAGAPPLEFMPGRVLVQFRSSASEAARADALRTIDGRIAMSIPRIEFHLVKFGTGRAVGEAVDLLRRHPAIAVVEPDYAGHLSALGVPADPCLSSCAPGKQWNVGAVNAHAGWEEFPGTYYTATTKQATDPVKVAVLDTRIEPLLTDWANRGWGQNHPESVENGGQLDLADEGSFLEGASEWGPYAYHGSFVAGILAAATDNTAGIAGLGYTAQIMPVTVVQGDGIAPASAVAAGITHAVRKGARVINMSLGLTADSAAVRAAVSDAVAAGVLLTAAAGNRANSEPFYPAWHPGVMAITAIGEDDRPGACTNFSPKTSVGAPGVGIVSLDPYVPTRLRKETCGTSTAAPHAAALAALLFQQNPARTAAQVRQIIERTADDARSDLYPGKDDHYGHGRLNFQRALMDHTTGLPQVSKLVATIPQASGGWSKATAFGSASSAKTLAGAEWFLDRVGTPGTGNPVRAEDGAFDEQTETLEGDIEVALNMKAGVYRLFVRARDVSGVWGPAAVAALVVDRVAPSISSLNRADGRPHTALPIQNQHMRLTFSITDDVSSRATYYFKVWREIAGAEQIAYMSQPKTVLLPFQGEGAQWMPQPSDAGLYNVTVYATDEGNNKDQASTQVIAV